MKNLAKFLAMAVVALMVSSPRANATVITFENGPIDTAVTSYSEAGFNFSVSSGYFYNSFSCCGPSRSLYVEGGFSNLLTVDNGGAAFDLVSFINDHDHGDSVLTASNGSVFNIPYGNEGNLQTFSAAFSNITWFTLFTGSHILIDDLTLNASTAVPAPGALMLLGFGLLGIGAMRRKHKAA